MRTSRLWIFAALAALSVLSQKFLGVTSLLGIYGDDACYLLEARRIIDGNICADCGLVVPPTGYARGWPLFLSLFVPLLGGDWDAYRWITIAVTAASVVLSFDLASRRFGAKVAALLATAVALSPVVLEFGHTAMSEPFYLFLVLVAVRLELAGVKPAVAVGQGLVAGLAASTRPEGVLLGAALLFHGLFAKRWKALGMMVLVATATVATVNWLSPNNSPYNSALVEYFQGIGSPGSFLFSQVMNRSLLLGRALLTLSAFWDRSLALVLVGAFLFHLYKVRALKLEHWMILGTTAVLLVWPYLSERYWLPVLPLILIIVLETVPRDKYRGFLLAFLIFGQLLTARTHPNQEPERVIAARQTLLRALAKTGPNEVVATPTPGYIHVWGHRSTHVLRGASSIGLMAVEMERQKANLVLAEKVETLIWSATGRQYSFPSHFPLWLERCSLFETVYAGEGGVLARLKTPAERLEIAFEGWQAGAQSSDPSVRLGHFEKALKAVPDFPELRVLWTMTALEKGGALVPVASAKALEYLRQYPHDFEGGAAMIAALWQAGAQDQARQAAELCYREAQRLKDSAASRFASLVSP